jgi:hypothetical protein
MKVDLEGRIEGQHRATYRSYFAPPLGQKHDLNHQQQKPESSPAGLEPAKSFSQNAHIDPAQRKIEQQNGNCRLNQP